MSYLPHTLEEREQMLGAIGASSMEDLLANVPPDLRSGPPNIPRGLSEMEVARLVGSLAGKNLDLDSRPSFLGAGAYHHYVPSVVPAITGRSEFYTSYTPYQAEVSQGTLQVIYEYQTMVSELFGLDVANASLYDAATGVVEAGTIAINHTGRTRLAVMGGLHPEYLAVLRTYTHGQGFELVELPESWVGDPATVDGALDDSVAALIVQSPNFWGALEPVRHLADSAHGHGALLISVNNPLSLGVLAPPGQLGADIGVGCGQPFGIPLAFGGPYVGFIAVREGLERRLPGRIAGATVDAQGRTGYVLTMQAREQHIRREKATSNICTNHALMALAATVYLAVLGKQGIVDLGTLIMRKARYAAAAIESVPGFRLAFSAPYFNEFTVETPVAAAEVNRFLLGHDIIGGLDLGSIDPALSNRLLLAFTETTSRGDIDDLVACLRDLQPASAAEQSRLLQSAGTGAQA